jgi:hypothetical protein
MSLLIKPGAVSCGPKHKRYKSGLDSILIKAQPYAITSLQPALFFWLDQGSSINCTLPSKHNVARQEAVSLKPQSGFLIHARNVIIH